MLGFGTLGLGFKASGLGIPWWAVLLPGTSYRVQEFGGLWWFGDEDLG